MSWKHMHAQISDAERKAYATNAIQTRWAKTTDKVAATEPMRDGWLRKLEDQADPEHKMSPEERREAAVRLRKAHMARIAAKSLATRRKRKQAREAAKGDDYGAA